MEWMGAGTNHKGLCSVLGLIIIGSISTPRLKGHEDGLGSGDRRTDGQDLRPSTKRHREPTVQGHCTPSSAWLVLPCGQTQERVLLIWSTWARFQSRQQSGEGWRVNLSDPYIPDRHSFMFDYRGKGMCFNFICFGKLNF